MGFKKFVEFTEFIGFIGFMGFMGSMGFIRFMGSRRFEECRAVFQFRAFGCYDFGAYRLHFEAVDAWFRPLGLWGFRPLCAV